MWKKIRNWGHDDKGATAVEFAMVSGLLLVTLIGFLEVGRMLWLWNSAQYCVSKGARYYLTHKTISDSDLQDYINGQLENVQIDSSKITLTIAKSTTSGINFIRISGTYTYSLFAYMLPSTQDVSLSVESLLPVDSSS